MLVLVFGALIGTLVSSAHLIRLLREKHRPLWLELGSPSFVPNLLSRGARDSSRLGKWVWSREYRMLGDPETANAASQLKLFSSVLTGAVVLLLLLAIGTRLRLG